MINIREATKEDFLSIATIRIDNWQTTYKGLLPQAFLDDLNYQKEASSWLTFCQSDDNQLWVATDSQNTILGFVATKPFQDEVSIGEIYALHTAQSHRGKGIGKALIYFSAQQFKSNNINEMRLWVVVGNNHAIDVYKHLGAETYIERIDQINNTDVPEIGMKWTDLSLLGISD